MHSFLVRLRNIDFFNDLHVRPPFVSSTEMMWQSVDGCGISDVLVRAQHRFQAQHFCLPCQPLRLKVCLCPSISSAFSLGLKQRSSLDFTGQCNEWQQTKDWWGKCQKKKAFKSVFWLKPRQETALGFSLMLSAQGLSPSLVSHCEVLWGFCTHALHWSWSPAFCPVFRWLSFAQKKLICWAAASCMTRGYGAHICKKGLYSRMGHDVLDFIVEWDMMF